ncbi:MAG: DUF4265 domain-containing protein, partial [Vulcanimicrobiaceae bacterium]
MLNRIKVGVILDCVALDDGTQWPPYEIEWLWVEPVVDTQYRIKNVPIYAMDLALDDVVSTRQESGEQGRRLFEDVVTRSGFSTFRAVARETTDDLSAENFFDALADIGCTLEGDG